MLRIPGYRYERTLFAGARCSVYAAVRLSDDVRVILKTTTHEAAAADVQRFRRTFSLTHDLAIVGSCRALELFEDRRRPYLVMQPFAGRPLAEWLRDGPLEPGHVLAIGLRLAEALARIHERGLVHCDLSPDNVLIAEDGAVEIIDFDLARRLPAEGAELSRTLVVEGTPPYMAPEQSGRLHRPVDQRADLYSLGATLYEMLTGAPPFRGDHAGGIIHSHLAAVPIAPHVVRASVPSPVSEIVLRLLAKEPDDRYQTAWGLAADLRLALTQLETRGRIDPFELGAADVSTRLRLDQHLHPRAAECELLLNRIQRAASGGTALTLVRGPSGVGKSVLLHRLFAPQARRWARVAAGGFEVRSSSPATGLRHAVSELVDLLLSESDERLAPARDAAIAALGDDAGLVADALPSLRSLIGPVESSAALPPDEARHRFKLAFRRLIQSLATERHPLVLIIDDLQRADSSDLELIAQLLTDPVTAHLLVVGAFRDDGGGDAGPLTSWTGTMQSRGLDLVTISLAPLSEAAVGSLIAAVLGASTAEIEPLTHEVMTKTQGNPLFVARFVQSLHRDGTLRVDPARGRWTWNIDRIRRLPYTENVAALMAQRVRLLTPPSRRVLAAAACLGLHFDPRVIAHALEMEPDEVLRHLWPALRDDLVEPPADAAADPPDPYRFAHDRIHAAAYELLPTAERTRMHLALGWTLAADDFSDAGRAAATTQLGLGMSLVETETARAEIAAIALDAGRAASISMAHSAARELLEVGLAALPDGASTTHLDTWLGLHLARAANAESLGEFDMAESLLEVAMGQARTVPERATVLTRRILLRSRRSDPMGAIEATRECLALFGQPLPHTPEEAVPLHAADDAILAELIAGRDLESLASGKPTSDPQILQLLQVMAAAANPAYAQPWVLGTLARRSVRLSLEHGPSPDSAHAFVLYGWIQSMMGNRDLAELFGRTGLALAETGLAAARSAPLHHLYATFIEHWRHPWSEGRARFERTLLMARRQGSYETGAWVVLNLAWLVYAAEDDLTLALRRMPELLAASRGEFEHRDAASNIMLTMLRVRELTGTALDDATGLDESFDERALIASLAHFPGYTAAYHVQRMIVRCLLGDLDEARAEIAPAAAAIPFAGASLWESRFHVFRALILTGLARRTPGALSDDEREALEASVREVKRYADYGSPGRAAERDLILAEVKAVRGEDDGVLALYDAAILGALESGDRAFSGLAAERCAAWFEARGDDRMARSYLFDARYAFERWGAFAKVARLDAHASLTRRVGSERLSPHAAGAEGPALELHSALAASRAVSGEIDLERLLGTLMAHVVEVAGATRGCLLLETEGRLRVEAAIEAPGETPRVMMGLPMAEHGLCVAVVQAVHRSGQPVQLEDARSSRRFARDPYIVEAQPRSLLCVPIVHQGRVLAILYLENTVLAGAFTRGRRHALDLISAQAAISIQNAFLFRREQEMAGMLRTTTAENIQLQIELQRAKGELLALRSRIDSQTLSLEATVRQRTADIERMHRHHDRVLRSIDQGIFCVDPGGVVYFANPAAARLGGWSDQELVGRTYHDLLVAEGGSKLPSLQGHAGDGNYEGRFLRAGGDSLPVEMSLQPIRDDAGGAVGAVVTFRDLTRRRELETQLQHAQKMEAMGQFAGGVAHDFNNLLTPMLGNVSLVRETVGDDFPVTLPWLEDIERAGGRAADLVKQVLAFSRRSEVFLRPIDPLPLIDDIVRFLQRSLQRSITVTWERPEQIPWIHADAGGIHQVLLNLCLNARDALHDRAKTGDSAELRLTIRAEEKRIDAAMAQAQPGLRPGHWVQLSVEDNGVGMSGPTRERVFEPFFTTKEVGAGTGLGLSVVYGIVQQHGGFVLCTSTQGQGTTMACSLPARAPGAAAVLEAAAPVVRGRGERVLIADDEPLMRSLGHHVLENLGYHVAVVDNGLAAVETFRDQPGAFELIILDISMPGMSGDEALQEILQIDSEARVILWSGYAAVADTKSAEQLGARAFLAKPFRADELGRIVRRVLDSP
ncbi:MAG: AAA family ATPase [Myxococcota bacterium]